MLNSSDGLTRDQLRLFLDRLSDFKEANETQFTDDLSKVLSLLLAMNDPAPKDPQNNGVSEFLVNDVLPTLTRTLILARSFRNKETLELANRILENSVLLAERAIEEDQPKLTEVLKFVLDPSRLYYKMNNQEENSLFSQKLLDEAPLFQKPGELKSGELVDVMKMDAAHKKIVWSQAKILDCHSEDFVKVNFLFDFSATDRYLETSSRQISKYGTNSQDFSWRTSLKIGDMVDYLDNSSNWYQSTIIDKKVVSTDGRDQIQILIGLRVYDETGDQIDFPSNRRFYGWPSRYDEWVNITSPRVLMKGTVIRGVQSRYKSVDSESFFDDSNDLVFRELYKGQPLFAVTRYQNRSVFLMSLLNQMGSRGFFERVIKRISDKSKYCSIDTLVTLLEIVYNVNPMLYRDFVENYVIRLKDAVIANILESPNSNIRNFSKEKIDFVIKMLGELLKRSLSVKEQYEVTEQFSLDVAFLCFSSEFLERKLQGLKTIMEIMREVKYRIKRAEYYLDVEPLFQWVNDKQIFECLYGKKAHAQLIQRSTEFLKFMMTEDFLTSENLDLIWQNLRKGNIEEKMAIYKVLNSVSLHMKQNHIDFLVSQMSEIPIEGFLKEDIELLFEITKYQLQGSQSLEVYWRLLCEIERIQSEEISDSICQKICEILRGYMEKKRIEILMKLVDNIESNVSVNVSLRMLKRIIEIFNHSPSSSEEYTRSSIVELLITEKSLIGVLLEDLRRFKSKNNELSKNYAQQIGDKIGLFGFMFNLTAMAFSFETLGTLWQETVDNSFCEAEKNVTYKLFRDILDSKLGKLITFEELKGFFTERLCLSKSWLKELSSEGFQLFKSLLFSINEKDQKIVKFSKKSKDRYSQEVYWQGSSLNSQYYSISYQNANTCNGDSDTDISEYRCQGRPDSLIGYEAIFQVFLGTQKPEVLKEIIEVLVNFETNSEISSSSELPLQRSIFLEKLRKILELPETPVFSALNILKLLKSFMNETESLGTGSIRSHESRLPAEYLQLIFVNELSYISDAPKRIELRVSSNITLYELRTLIAKKILTNTEQIRLVRSGEIELLDKENGLLLRNLKLKSEETLTIKRKYTQEIPQAPLLTASGDMNPALATIIKELFSRFSTNGLMSKAQCAKFRGICVNDPRCDATDPRIHDLFRTWDDDEDGFLNEENFLSFYLAACRSGSSSTVYKNLECFHYRPDFKTQGELEKESSICETTLPRYLMGQDEKWYEVLFRLLEDEGELADQALEILMRLESWGKILSDIRNAKKEDMRKVLHSENKSRLLYGLQIIEYLMEEGENEWKLAFIEQGGFEDLNEVFKGLLVKREDNRFKSVIACILKIFKTYLLSAFESRVQFLQRDAGFISDTRFGLDKIAAVLCPRKESKESAGSNETFIEEVKFARKKSVEMLENSQKTKSFNENLLALYNCDLEANQAVKIRSRDIEDSPESKAKGLAETLDLREQKDQNLIISKDFAENILKFFDLSSLLDLLLEFIAETLNRNHDFEVEDRNILEYSLTLVFGTVCYDTPLFQAFYTKLEALILSGIFFEKSVLIRKYVSRFGYVLFSAVLRITKARGFLQTFFAKLMESLQRNKGNKEREEFFELLCQLLELAISEGGEKIEAGGQNQRKADGSFDWNAIYRELIESIYHHPSSENRNGKTVDRVLIGLMRVFHRLLNLGSEIDEAVIPKLFNMLLFDPSNLDSTVGDFLETADEGCLSREIKCKSPESRKVAYGLILDLVRNRKMAITQLIRLGTAPLLKKTSQLLQENLDYFRNTGFNFIPAQNSRSSYGYVGIKNLGCICYMNAMLQQFFMTPAFRYCLLMADDRLSVSTNPQKQQEYLRKPCETLFDDNILHQLQNMFTFLELSDRIDYNPQGFCFAFKDFQGNPVNVSIQQDAQEFLNMIFDKLENGLKCTPFNSLLDNVYGGRSCMQLICGECGKKKEREELFYNLSLEVKNLKTLYESFEKYISGETISDYHCENCDKRAQTTKRSCISRFPNVLIIHLQRIVFDLDTLQNEKISTRLEFPFDLDLYNYSYEKVEGLQVESNKLYQYKLVGVVVHTGTAQYGHYYSYINIRNDVETRNRGASFENKWLEFNDTIVRDFDLKNLESECFGGSVDYQDDWNWGSSRGTYAENSKSAYILIYEREHKTPIQLKLNDKSVPNASDPEEISSIQRNAELLNSIPNSLQNYLQLSKYISNGVVSLPFSAVRPFAPERFHAVVSRDNSKFMFERLLFNEEFFKFTGQLLHSISIPQLTPNIYSLGYETIFQGEDEETRELQREMIDILFHLIYDILARSNENLSIVEFSSLLKHLLYLNPDVASQQLENFMLKIGHKEFILTCQDRIVRTYCSSILLHVINITIAFNGLTLDENIETSLERKVQSFLGEFLNLLKTDLSKNSSKFQQYFEFWRDFTYSGQKQLAFLLRKQVVSQFLDFLLDTKSPLHDNSKSSSSSIGSLKLPATYFDPLLQTVSYIISQTTENQLSELDRMMIRCPELYEKSLKDNLDAKSVCGFLEKLAWENEKFSMIISTLILKGLHKVMFDEARPYCDAFTILLNLKDSLQEKRIQWLLGFPQVTLTCNANGFDNFGLYGQNNLDEFHICFASQLTVDNSMTVLEVMGHNINRVESVCCLVLKHLLLLSYMNENIFNYIATLPPPCYLYAKYCDWFKPFLDKYGLDLNKNYYSESKKKEIHAEAAHYLDFFLSKFNEKFQSPQKMIPEPEKTSVKVEEKIEEEEPPALVGQMEIEQKEAVEQKEAQNNKETSSSKERNEDESLILVGLRGKKEFIIGQTMNETFTELKRTEDYIFSVKEFTVLALLSKPTGKTNLAIPYSFVRDHYLFPSSVDSNSPFAGFVHSKYTYSENYGKKTNKISHYYQLFKSKLALNFAGININNSNLNLTTSSKEEKPLESKPPSSNAGSLENSQDLKEFNEMTEKIKLFQFECLRKFLLDNRSNKYLLVVLQITGKEGAMTNSFELKEPLLMMVRPYSTVDLFFLQKIDFEAPWDDYSVNLRVFNVFSPESVVKETRLFLSYYDQRDSLSGDTILIQETNPPKTSSSGVAGRTREFNLEGKGKDGKRKKVGFEVDQEFELFAEEDELSELRHMESGGYPGT